MSARLCTAVLVLSVSAVAGDRLTQAQAMALAFPGATVERHEHFLTPAQVDAVKAKAGVELKTKYVVVYEAKKDGALAGVAIFDTHVVRTAPETAMVAISPDGHITRVEVVQFREPLEYAAPDRWVGQLTGEALGPALSLGGDIKPLSGASLTAQALVDASRRALALYQVLQLGGPKPAASGGDR